MRRRMRDIDAATMSSNARFIWLVPGPSCTPTKIAAAMSSVRRLYERNARISPPRSGHCARPASIIGVMRSA